MVEDLLDWEEQDLDGSFASAMETSRGNCRTFGDQRLIANTVDLWCWLGELRFRVSKDLRTKVEATQKALCSNRDSKPNEPIDGLRNGRKISCDAGLLHVATIGSGLNDKFSGLSVYFPESLDLATTGVTLSAYSRQGKHGLSFRKDHPKWLEFLEVFLDLVE